MQKIILLLLCSLCITFTHAQTGNIDSIKQLLQNVEMNIKASGFFKLIYYSSVASVDLR